MLSVQIKSQRRREKNKYFPPISVALALHSGVYKQKKMDACQSVERELDKVTNKFRGIEAHTSHTLQDLISHVNNIKQELAEGSSYLDLNIG